MSKTADRKKGSDSVKGAQWNYSDEKISIQLIQVNIVTWLALNIKQLPYVVHRAIWNYEDSSLCQGRSANCSCLYIMCVQHTKKQLKL